MSATDLTASLARGQALIDLGRFAEAASMIRPVLAHDPSNADAACLLAQAELLASNDGSALDAALLAVKLAPERAWSHRLMAISYARIANNEDEIRHAREAVRIDPHDASGYGCLARALARKKADLARARQAADECVRLAPDSVDAHLALGFVCQQARDRATAEAALRRALAIDPQNSAAHNNLGRLRLNSSLTQLAPDTLADAASGFATAVRTNPSGRTSRLNLDLVIRVFLARTAYLIFLDAWICTRLTPHSANEAAHLLPLALLALPLAFAFRFLHRIGPSLRSHVACELRSDSRISRPAALIALASALIVASAAAQSHRTGLAASAALLAFLGLIQLHNQVRVIGAKARGEPLKPTLGTTTLWIITAALALTAAFLIGAYANTVHNNVIELVVAGVFAGLALTVAAIATRRRHR